MQAKQTRSVSEYRQCWRRSKNAQMQGARDPEEGGVLRKYVDRRGMSATQQMGVVRPPPRAVAALLLIPALVLLFVTGCGEGWDAYEAYYRNTDPGDPGEPWTGPETVFVVLGAERVETPLEGIITSGFPSASGLLIPSVLLADLVEISGVTAEPASYRYDFTATDGYNLLRKRNDDLALLPDWENMHHGYLYSSDQGDLRVGWDGAEQPWGSAVSAYNLKYMDGGVIELLEP